MRGGDCWLQRQNGGMFLWIVFGLDVDVIVHCVKLFFTTKY